MEFESVKNCQSFFNEDYNGVDPTDINYINAQNEKNAKIEEIYKRIRELITGLGSNLNIAYQKGYKIANEINAKDNSDLEIAIAYLKMSYKYNIQNINQFHQYYYLSQYIRNEAKKDPEVIKAKEIFEKEELEKRKEKEAKFKAAQQKALKENLNSLFLEKYDEFFNTVIRKEIEEEMKYWKELKEKADVFLNQMKELDDKLIEEFKSFISSDEFKEIFKDYSKKYNIKKLFNDKNKTSSEKAKIITKELLDYYDYYSTYNDHYDFTFFTKIDDKIYDLNKKYMEPKKDIAKNLAQLLKNDYYNLNYNHYSIYDYSSYDKKKGRFFFKKNDEHLTYAKKYFMDKFKQMFNHEDKIKLDNFNSLYEAFIKNITNDEFYDKLSPIIEDVLQSKETYEYFLKRKISPVKNLKDFSFGKNFFTDYNKSSNYEYSYYSTKKSLNKNTKQKLFEELEDNITNNINNLNNQKRNDINNDSVTDLAIGFLSGSGIGKAIKTVRKLVTNKTTLKKEFNFEMSFSGAMRLLFSTACAFSVVKSFQNINKPQNKKAPTLYGIGIGMVSELSGATDKVFDYALPTKNSKKEHFSLKK